jgi:hypothetical protein
VTERRVTRREELVEERNRKEDKKQHCRVYLQARELGTVLGRESRKVEGKEKKKD